MIVGLTGGIGSGKSTVAKFFSELDIPVYDSDKEAKWLMTNSTEIKKGLVDLFGPNAYLNQKLNKTLISEIVFKDKDKLNELNKIVHPAVRNHFIEWVMQQRAPYVIQESALIFENDLQKNYDAIILVTAPEAIRIARVMQRDEIIESQVRARIANQLSEDKKIDHVDFVIENLDKLQTKNRVHEIHEKLLKRVSGAK